MTFVGADGSRTLTGEQVRSVLQSYGALASSIVTVVTADDPAPIPAIAKPVAQPQPVQPQPVTQSVPDGHQTPEPGDPGDGNHPAWRPTQTETTEPRRSDGNGGQPNHPPDPTETGTETEPTEPDPSETQPTEPTRRRPRPSRRRPKAHPPTTSRTTSRSPNRARRSWTTPPAGQPVIGDRPADVVGGSGGTLPLEQQSQVAGGDVAPGTRRAHTRTRRPTSSTSATWSGSAYPPVDDDTDLDFEALFSEVVDLPDPGPMVRTPTPTRPTGPPRHPRHPAGRGGGRPAPGDPVVGAVAVRPSRSPGRDVPDDAGLGRRGVPPTPHPHTPHCSDRQVPAPRPRAPAPVHCSDGRRHLLAFRPQVP
jgi:hypothetical protein